MVLKGAPAATLAQAQSQGDVTLNVGVFLNAVIQFLIVSFAIFWVVKALSRLQRRQTDEAAAPPPTRTEALLEEIRDGLRRPAGQGLPPG